MAKAGPEPDRRSPKEAIRSVTRGVRSRKELAKDLAEWGITVNALMPGLIRGVGKYYHEQLDVSLSGNDVHVKFA